MLSIRGLVVVTLFFLLNVTLSLLNRWALGIQGFSFPMFLTMFQALFTFCCVLIAMIFSPTMTGDLRRLAQEEWKGILAVGFWMSLNIALNNYSLGKLLHNYCGSLLTLSDLNTSITPFRCRASIPLVTASIATVQNRRLPPVSESLGLLVLCGGVSLAIGEASASGNMIGVSLCLLSVVSGAFMLITTGNMLHGSISAIQLAFLTAPVTFVCLCPPFVMMERDALVDYVLIQPKTAVAIVIAGSILAVLYNIVHNDLVGITGPVTTTVLGQVKIVVLMLLSGLLFDEGKDFSFRMSLGCAAAILGFSLYSWARMKHQLATTQTGLTTPSPHKINRQKSITHTPGKMKRIPNLCIDVETPPQPLPGLFSPETRLSARSSSSMRSRRTPGALV